MVDQTVKSLLISIRDIMGDLEHSKYQLRVAFSKNKPGEWQRQKAHNTYLKRKLRSLMDAMRNKINGKIIIIKFKVVKFDGSDPQTFEAAFTNITQQEVEDLLSIQAALEGGKLEILEIKEIPTYYKSIPL